MNKKYNVIIADDLDDHLALMYATLRAAGCFKVTLMAFDGRQVIEYLSGLPPFHDRQVFPMPHLLLLDLKMLRVDGFDVLRWVRDNRAPVIPIAVTSYANLHSEQMAMSLGAAALLTKPLDAEDARRILQIADDHFAAVPMA